MKKLLLFSFFSIISVLLISQTTVSSFEKEIAAFKKKDSTAMPSPNSILLVGSSSFTKWVDVQDYFPGFYILNRGFGGSSLPDLFRYAEDVFFPYHPKQIIIYCGENDIASSDTISAQMVLQRFQKLYTIIRSKLPNVSLAFMSIKPSPSRWKFEPVIVEANNKIKKFLHKQSKTKFINVHDAMLNKDGTVKEELFLADKLHMNAKGYVIWKEIMKPFLKS